MKFKDQGSVFDFAGSLRRTCKLSLGVAATIAAAALAFALARSRLAGGVAGDATPGLRASQAYEFMHEAAADEALTEPGSPRAPCAGPVRASPRTSPTGAARAWCAARGPRRRGPALDAAVYPLPRVPPRGARHSASGAPAWAARLCGRARPLSTRM